MLRVGIGQTPDGDTRVGRGWFLRSGSGVGTGSGTGEDRRSYPESIRDLFCSGGPRGVEMYTIRESDRTRGGDSEPFKD